MARALYAWARWLAGPYMAPVGDFEALNAQRMERIAREWHARYHQLRRKEAADRIGRLVQF